MLLFGKSEKTSYDANNNPTSYTAPGRTVSTTYDYGSTDAQQKKHLLLKSVSPLGTVMSSVYNTYGLPTQTQTANSNASLFMRGTTGYTSTSNYVATQTDARGKTTTTATDANKGTVTSVTDPRGDRDAQPGEAQHDLGYLRRCVQLWV